MNSSQLHLTDVTLRDGLQMEAGVVALEGKLKLWRALSKCGYARLEITSFSHPKWMPQFADSASLCEAIFQKEPSVPAGIEWMAFVPNLKGLERCLQYPIPWVSAFVAATETFNQKNVNASIDETLGELKRVVDKAHEGNRKVRLYISTVFGCPYEGAVSEKSLTDIFTKVAALKPDEIALSDTIGVAVPSQVESVLKLFAPRFPVEKTALHLHNTYGLAIASALTGYQLGVRRFDGSTGGVGGCPYAKGATGNVPTEELLYAFHRSKGSAFAWKEISAALKLLDEDLKVNLRSRLYDILKKGGTLYAIQS